MTNEQGVTMSIRRSFASLYLVTTALVAPALCYAQGTTGPAGATATPPAAPDASPAAPAPEEQTDISIPGAGNSDAGAEIVVTGRRTVDIVRTTPQVVSVLSSVDIARTGEGNIAGALGRVTGLSVVGNGFVYVRGLGDRYSLALLNGSPLPSPEPLRRVVPLDLFPSAIISSSLVQKTYSANFPGEFGGGVINLTTKTVPKESFLTVGGSIGGNNETTGQLGYVYFGSRSDWTGFDNGSRNTPPALAAYYASGNRISQGNVNTAAIASQLVAGRMVVLQRNTKMPPNFTGSLTGGHSFDLGGSALGIIANFGYSNKWRTRDTLQQTANSADLSTKGLDFQRVITEDRIVVNGLVGASLEFGKNKIRWTNLYIRDTLKQARLGVGTRNTSGSATLQQQSTAWFERQLIDTQLVGEFRLADGLSLDLRGGYANSQRESPNEFEFEYSRSNDPADPFGNFFINQLNNGQRGSASVSYSDLNEDLWSGGIDLSYKVIPEITATVGYAYVDTKRRTDRRDFQFIAQGGLPAGVALFRPDLLLLPSNINAFNIRLVDGNEANPSFRSILRNHAAYGQLQVEFNDALSLNMGVRWEKAKQEVTPIQVFTVPTASLAGTSLNRTYWLPAATLTWKFADNMQLRLNGSKTIARPQFRELIFQPYFDPDINREFRGNPLLVDSQLYNAELRYEWYFAKDQRLAVAGFFKRIDKPIEVFASTVSDDNVVSSFANAPRADLYGVEFETQKYFPLEGISSAPFWQSRRAVVIANYTYTKSKINVKPTDTTAVFASSSTTASDYFRNGSPLTGQSNHLVNVQLGLEDQDRLSQQTILFSYASRRVTTRGASSQPDIIEVPGIQLDFVARQGIKIAGVNTELKFEVRNITGTKYKEFQQSGANFIYYNLYKIGTSASIGLSVNF